MAGPRELAAIALLSATAGWLTTTSLQQDFAAYYVAAEARRAGLDPYVNHAGTSGAPWDGVAIFRHSRFLYPPLVADLFRPIARLPYVVAKAIFTAVSVAAWLFALRLAWRGAGSPSRRADAPDVREPRQPPAWTWTAAALWPPVLVTLERGQIDLIVLALVILAWRTRHHPIRAGAALALAALAKPIVLAALPLMALARYWRWLGATALAIGTVVALNIAIAGPAACRRYVDQVLPRAAVYGEGGTADMLLRDETLAALPGDLATGYAVMQGRRYVQEVGSFRRSASLARLLAGEDEPSRLSAIVLFTLLMAVAAWVARASPDRPTWLYAGLAAAILTAPVSWAMSLSWLMPFVVGGIANLDLCSMRGQRLGPALRARRGQIACALAFGAGLLGPLTAVAWVVCGAAALLATVLLAQSAAAET